MCEMNEREKESIIARVFLREYLGALVDRSRAEMRACVNAIDMEARMRYIESETG